MGITLDTGALIAAERGDRRLRGRLRAIERQGELPTVPTAAITEAWRDGARQAELARLLAWAEIEPLDEPLARRAGELLGRTGAADAVDAIVAASAARRGDVIATSDPDDLQRLADDLGSIRVVPV